MVTAAARSRQGQTRVLYLAASRSNISTAPNPSPGTVTDRSFGMGRTAVVDLAITTQFGQELDEVNHGAQERAIGALRSNAGLTDVWVNVTIDDAIT